MKRNLAALLILGIFCFLSCGERETKLFNGKNLDGWAFHLAPDSTVPATDVFGVKDGVIAIAGQPFGYMLTEESYDNYKLHLECAGRASPPIPASSCTPSPSTPSGPAVPKSISWPAAPAT